MHEKVIIKEIQQANYKRATRPDRSKVIESVCQANCLIA